MATGTRDKQWVSPFTPEMIDPRVSKKTKEEIDAQFPTKSEIRAVIPPHCFERSLLRSLGCVTGDILQGVAVWYITYHVVGLSVDPPEGGLLGNPLGWIAWRLAWNVYGAVMGFALGGLWVLGHECGHGAFSAYPVVNGAMGWILHSIMLVPYYSWAFSHAKHHRQTNHLTDGETHMPRLYDEVGLKKLKDDNGTPQYERLPEDVVEAKLSLMGEGLSYPLYGHALAHEEWGDEGFTLVIGWVHLFLGWQAYLFGIASTGKIGADRKPIEKGTFPDHFRPHSRLFPAKMYWKVIWSDIGIGLVVSALIYFSWRYSFRAVWFWYFGPYIVVHNFLVTITWLQHTDPTVPHFDLDQHSWMKAGLAGTIDRPFYGWLNHLSHNIVTTHVVHHLFHELPHYHAVEATKHVRAFLEPKGLYNYDPTDMCLALYKVCKTCHFVDSLNDGIQYYRSFQEVPKSFETEDKNKKTK